MTQETFEQMVERIAHRSATQYKHTAEMGLPKYLFSGSHLIDFATSLRDELEKGQEPVAHIREDGQLEDLRPWSNDTPTPPFEPFTSFYTRPFVAAPAGVPDFEPDAKRLALELECLLLDCKDMAAVSKWWDSAHEALEQHRAMLSAAAPTDAVAKDAELLDFLEMQTHGSSTGVSFDWCKVVEDGRVVEHGYRVSWRKHLGDRRLSLRAAIDAAMQEKERGK